LMWEEMKMKRLFCHLIFAFGWCTAFWGAFEQAVQNPNAHPIWSGTWGAPIPHHYIIGFALCLIGYVGLSWRELVEKVLGRDNA